MLFNARGSSGTNDSTPSYLMITHTRGREAERESVAALSSAGVHERHTYASNASTSCPVCCARAPSVSVADTASSVLSGDRCRTCSTVARASSSRPSMYLAATGNNVVCHGIGARGGATRSEPGTHHSLLMCSLDQHARLRCMRTHKVHA